MREVERIGLHEPVPRIHPILDIGSDVGLEEEGRAIKEGHGDFLLTAIRQAAKA